MTQDYGAGTVIDRLFGALGGGDIDAAVACFAPDGTVWHSFDCVVHDRDSMARDWAGFVGAFPERAFADARRQATADGCVQQHLMVGRTATGVRKAWPVCVVVRVDRDGLIVRLDEYIDRAGAFTLADDAPAVTPGLA